MVPLQHQSLSVYAEKASMALNAVGRIADTLTSYTLHSNFVDILKATGNPVFTGLWYLSD